MGKVGWGEWDMREGHDSIKKVRSSTSKSPSN